MMPIVTILSGVALVAIGIWGFVTSDKSPITAMIPVGFGVAFLFLGAMAFKQGVRKHVMHAVSVIALLGVLGGGGKLIHSLFVKVPPDTLSNLAPQVTLLMTVTCLTLLGLCINSFVQARLARKREAAQPTQPVS